MLQVLENEVLLSSLESIFQEASKDAYVVSRLSLAPVAERLSQYWQMQELNFQIGGSSLYWLSCLLLWKSQWLLLQAPHGSIKLAKTRKPRLKKELSAREKDALIFNRRKEVDSLVMYLGHKTFKTLSLQRELCSPSSKIDLKHLEELYQNLSQVKEKNKVLKHIGLHLTQRNKVVILPCDWHKQLLSWSEKKPINQYWHSLPKEQRLALFQDLLFRQKKGELTLVQEKPNAVIYVKVLTLSAVSYG